MTREHPAEDLRPCADVIARLHKYARRWVVDFAPDPTDALIYDAVLQLAATHIPSLRRGPDDDLLASAVAERVLRHGEEPVTESFNLPVTLRDAAERIHRYARRYTNGRGGPAAGIVNAAARDLIANGTNLDHTRTLDGTIWAADGEDGAHDGLEPDQRAEALATLPRDTP